MYLTAVGKKERGYSLKSVIVHQVINRRGDFCMLLLCKKGDLDDPIGQPVVGR